MEYIGDTLIREGVLWEWVEEKLMYVYSIYNVIQVLEFATFGEDWLD